ncbi:MAG: cyclic nucleotide-binding domain-containing protein [Desulfobacterium sp.]|nr:cyclic nucleotide-binding domain-containing protein [Desulfobacterium sp.]
MAQELEILKNSTVFNSLELSDLQRLGSLMEPLEIQEGETLATMGEEATRFFILASGTLLVAMDGGKALVMDEPGGFIAMQILSSNGKYLSTVTALEPGLVFVLNKTDFIDLIQEDSLMADMIMEEWNVFLEESAPFVEDKGTPGFEYNY